MIVGDPRESYSITGRDQGIPLRALPVRVSTAVERETYVLARQLELGAQPKTILTDSFKPLLVIAPALRRIGAASTPLARGRIRLCQHGWSYPSPAVVCKPCA
jgi:hypothetical protein